MVSQHKFGRVVSATRNRARHCKVSRHGTANLSHPRLLAWHGAACGHGTFLAVQSTGSARHGTRARC
eukprot:5228536-Pyramimonas_sp.AAC.1